MDIEKTREYLEREFGIRTVQELEDACEKTRDIDIGLFVTPIFWEERRVAQWEEGGEKSKILSCLEKRLWVSAS